MTLNLEILSSAAVHAPQTIETLNEKQLCPNMMLRRRLTRSAKLFYYLASSCGYGTQDPIVYGSAFGEVQSTVDVVLSILQKENTPPTAFQNSVYNTAPSYFSIGNGIKEEIITLSSGDQTSLDVLKTAALYALEYDEILAVATETWNIPGIHTLNRCSDMLEAGVALRLKKSVAASNLTTDNSVITGFPPSLAAMLHAHHNAQEQKTIIEVEL